MRNENKNNKYSTLRNILMSLEDLDSDYPLLFGGYNPMRLTDSTFNLSFSNKITLQLLKKQLC